MIQRLTMRVLCAMALGGAALVPAAYADTEEEVRNITQAEPSEADQRLTEAVKQHLNQDPEVLALMDDVQIKAVDGVLYAKGTVFSDTQKTIVEKYIRSCPGVSNVRSFIDVRKSPVDTIR